MHGLKLMSWELRADCSSQIVRDLEFIVRSVNDPGWPRWWGVGVTRRIARDRVLPWVGTASAFDG